MFTLDLNQQELNAIFAILDSATRYDGLKNIDNIKYLKDKFNNATPKAPESPEVPEVPKTEVPTPKTADMQGIVDATHN